MIEHLKRNYVILPQTIIHLTMNNKMKIIGLLVFFLGFYIVNGMAQNEIAPAKSNVYTVDIDESYITWTGSKPLGEHFGTLRLKKGQLEFQNNSISGGFFTIDMNTLKVDDIKDEEMNAKLLGHLQSPDFFNVAEFSESHFQMTEAKMVKAKDYNYAISGNLTMKGISHPITFYASVHESGQILKAHAPQFEIDRTKWDIKFKSKSFFENLKDNFIDDEIGIEIQLLLKQ